MPGNYFAGAPNAFAGGQEFAAAQRQRRHRENALNALIERFGPEAADPSALAAMQGIDQRAQLFPHQVAEAQAETAARDANVAQFGAAAGSSSAMGVRQTVQGNLQSAGLNFARMLQAAKAKDPQTLNAAFDRGLPVLQAMGWPTEQLAGLRERLVSDPDFVDEFAALLSNGNGGDRALSGGQPMRNRRTGQWEMVIPTESGHRVIEGYEPSAPVLAEARLAQGDARLRQQARALSLDEAKARGLGEQYQWFERTDPATGEVTYSMTPQEGSKEEEERMERESTRAAAQEEAVQAAREMGERYQLGSQYATSALARLNQQGGVMGGHNLLSGVARELAAKRAGTDTFEIQQDFDRLRGIIAIDQLLAIKRAGGTLGQVTERELDLLQNQLGAWDIRRNADALRADLTRIMETFNRIVERSQMQGARAQERQRNPGAYNIPGAPQRRPSSGSRGYQFSQDDEELLGRYAPR